MVQTNMMWETSVLDRGGKHRYRRRLECKNISHPTTDTTLLGTSIYIYIYYSVCIISKVFAAIVRLSGASRSISVLPWSQREELTSPGQSTDSCTHPPLFFIVHAAEHTINIGLNKVNAFVI